MRPGFTLMSGVCFNVDITEWNELFYPLQQKSSVMSSNNLLCDYYVIYTIIAWIEDAAMRSANIQYIMSALCYIKLCH